MYKIQVIVPLLNAENHIKNFIDGIIINSIIDYNVLFIDSSSTDSTISYLKEAKLNYHIIARKNIEPSVKDITQILGY